MISRLLVALILSMALPVSAQVYKWVDEQGRIQYSNAPPPSVAGKAEAIEEKLSIMGMDPAVRAWAERRFAALEREEEQHWQRRHQAMLLSQQYRPAASTPPAPSYPSTYADGMTYYPTFVSRPVLTKPVFAPRPPRPARPAGPYRPERRGTPHDPRER